jgi:ankyrin repeat protein
MSTCAAGSDKGTLPPAMTDVPRFEGRLDARMVAWIEAGDDAAVLAAIADDPTCLAASTDDADTLLHLACWRKRSALVEVLVVRGAAIDARGCYGRSPLHYAVHEGNAASPAIVACLLAAGADSSARDDAGFSVEDWAKVELEADLADVLALLRRTGPRPSPIRGAVDPEQLAAMIEEGDVPAVASALARNRLLLGMRRSNGDLPMHVACLHKQVAIVGTLIAHGPELDARGHRGQRPLHAAVREGGAISICLVSMLLSLGADPDAVDDDGVSVAALATAELQVGREQVLGLLRDAARAN